MKNNYPIVYAVIPMIEQIGWTSGIHELEREYGPVCYIVAKCYLVNRSEKYYRDGSTDKKYSVVCPYTYVFGTHSWVRQEPLVGLNATYINSITVDDIYDTFEEASKVKTEKNDDLFQSKFLYLSTDEINEKYESIKSEFNEKLDYYEQLEKAMESDENTLDKNYIPKEQTTILFRNGDGKVVNDSIYNIMNIFSRDDYIAYSVSEDEYKKIQIAFKEGLDISKFNHTPLLKNNKTHNLLKVISPKGDEKYISKGALLNAEITCQDFDKNYYKFTFYTTEDYEDIINSCKKYEEIVLVKKRKPNKDNK